VVETSTAPVIPIATQAVELQVVLCQLCGQSITRMRELEAQNAALQAEVVRLMVELERWRRTGGLGKAMGASVGARSARATLRSSWRRKSGRRGDMDDVLDDDDDDSGLASFDFAPHPVLGRADDTGGGIAATAFSVASTSKRNVDTDHGE
jgi:hypothetical protein